jgi:hypothetical protein
MKLLQKLIILMSVISFAGCGWFGGDKKEVEEVVKSDASSKSEGAAKTEGADKENKDETADASKKKKNEGKEKGFFASITSILPGSDEVQEVQKDEDSKLQVARLIARVEELTSHVIKMQSRLVVLEKSVHLGISPESMNSKIVVDGGNLSANSAPTQVSPSYTGNSGMHTNVVQEQNSVAQIPTQVKSSKFDDYQRDLNKAISQY